ncbi:kelch-like protein 36 [Babylonia areolata]|uniref:kelch-like protein 36 n=1 Tax=Babylonia areolata TaxID=304850 RepID=UPI003FD4FECA
MATSGTGDGAEVGQRFECIVIEPGKLKYMNPNFNKVQGKMYDYKCDIKLTVQGANFKAHRDVLAEASDYFSAMFSHDMLEREKDVITLQGVSPGGFAVILDYFYHGHVTIDHDNIEDVLEASRFFHVEFLVEACCDYLVHQLGMENYQNVLILADKYWLGDLRADIFAFLGSNIMKLSEEKHFFENLDADLLVQFLKEDLYVDAPEDFLLFLVRRWVKTREEERKDLLLPLLRLIRFPLIDIETLETMPHSVTQFPEVEDAVEEAKHYNNNISAQCQKQELRFCARGTRPNVVMFSFPDGRFILNYRSMDSENPSTCLEEIESKVVGVDFSYTMMVTMGDFQYATGGYDLTVCSNSQMFRYNARTREWLELASMIQTRVSHSMCAAGGQIVVVGGVDHQVGENGEKEEVLASAEIYDVMDNAWIPLPDLVYGSYDHASVINDGVVYITGGISGDPYETIPTAAAYKLRLGSEAWEPMRGMLHPRQGHSLTAVNNRLFAVGGYTCYQDQAIGGFRDCVQNEVYDLETNQWTEITPTPPSFGHLLRSVALHANKIYIFGNGHLGCYDVDKDAFECLEYYGQFIQKLAVMRVAYPSARHIS